MLATHLPDPPTLIGPIGVFTARSLPMLAMRVACGFPSPAEDFFREDDRLDLNEKLIRNPHKGDGFHVSRAVPFPYPTRDTSEVLRALRFLATSMMKPGLNFKRGGVGLQDLVRSDQRHADLFFGPDERAERGMDVLDKINRKFGRGTVGLGSTGWRVGGSRPGERRVGGPDAQWRPILKTLSPAYTTKWSDLLRVR